MQRIHCLSWDVTTSSRLARLLADLRTARQAMLIKGSVIAATGNQERGSFSWVRTCPFGKRA